MSIVDWRPGDTITAGRLRSISPIVQPWTPTWTTSTGSALPDFGDASLDCKFAVAGGLCFGQLVITFGSTTDFGTSPTGSDNWEFTPPVPAVTGTAVGYGEIRDASAGLDSRISCRLWVAGTGNLRGDISSGRVDGTAAGGVGTIDSVTPWTWAVDDQFRFFFQFETVT